VIKPTHLETCISNDFVCLLLHNAFMLKLLPLMLSLDHDFTLAHLITNTISKHACLMTPFAFFSIMQLCLSFSHLSFDLITISHWFMQKCLGQLCHNIVSMNLFEVTFANRPKKKFSSNHCNNKKLIACILTPIILTTFVEKLSRTFLDMK
jgi:hypothetical protein